MERPHVRGFGDCAGRGDTAVDSLYVHISTHTQKKQAHRCTQTHAYTAQKRKPYSGMPTPTLRAPPPSSWQESLALLHHEGKAILLCNIGGEGG